MSEENREAQAEAQQTEEKISVPLAQSIGIGAGTFLVAGAVDLLAHLGPTGLVVGAIAAYVASQHGPELCEQVREALPSPGAGESAEKSQWSRGRSFMDRALGRFPESDLHEEEDQETEVPTRPGEETPGQSSKKLLQPSVFTIGPDNKTLKLGFVVKTRQRFDPPMNMLLGRGGLLAGSQGTGKSNIIGLVTQSGGQCGMPIVIIDYKGEFYTVRDVVPNGILAGHPSYADEVGAGFFPLTVETAATLAEIVMEGPFQVVVDIPSYNGDGDEVAQVIAALLHGLMDWSRKMRREGKEPWPCLVITDEAHNFLPERQKLSGLVMRRPAESFGALTGAYSRMANTGRSFGYTLLLATQRLPNIAKWSIANLQVKVVLAHAEKNDLDACEEETGGLVDREEIKHLGKGTGIVIGLTKEPMIVHFDKQLARHVSNTPAIERVHEAFKDVPRPHLSRILAQRNPTPGQYEHKASTHQQRVPLNPVPRHEERVEEIPSPPYLPHALSTEHATDLEQRPLRHQEKYDRAITVWHELEEKQMATMRDFAVAMGIGETKAYNQLCEMDRLGLIHWERKKKKVQ